MQKYLQLKLHDYVHTSQHSIAPQKPCMYTLSKQLPTALIDSTGSSLQYVALERVTHLLSLALNKRQG